MPEIDTLTKLYCVIGNPVKHSVSPAMMNAAFNKTGINAAYLSFEVSDIAGAVTGIRALGVAGASITIPHKINIIKYLDEVTDIAIMCGAVNTVINENGKLTGTNTDAAGLYMALSGTVQIEGKSIAIFGSGGSARAAAFALISYSKPGSITIVARNQSARQDLLSGLSCSAGFKCRIASIAPADWGSIMDSIDIIINTTPVGMYPNSGDSILRKEEIKEGSVVFDIVYRPYNTKLLQQASERNCIRVFGSQMLIYQGMEQFRLWTGIEAPESDMKKAVMKILKEAKNG